MLLELNIKNFAIIEDMNINLTKGLNVLTGETGSGKSIIIEALGIILGGRGTKHMIQKGKEKATLQALFVINRDNKLLKNRLDKYGIENNGDNLLLFTREIHTDSPSISRINGKTVTLNVLKDISSNLIDIFAQQEHQSLLDIKNHKKIIDSFGDDDLLNLKEDIRQKYFEYKKVSEELDNIDIDPIKREREVELLKYQLNEIIDANLDLDKDKDIEDEFKKFENLSFITKSINQSRNIIKSDDFEAPCVLNLLSTAVSELNEIKEIDSSIEQLYERMESVVLELEDINNDMNHYLNSLDINEERYLYLETRLNVLNTLKRKYGNSLESILEFSDKLTSKLEELLNHEKIIERLEKEKENLRIDLIEKSKVLSDKRRIISRKLEKEIASELKDLNMSNVLFKVDFKEKKNPSVDGMDDIEFLIATNKGSDLNPLTEIVSGGEMSRIMLGFKSILANYDDIDTMIFDEIDTGISGRTAQVVGEKISNISKRRQVITITHLPQIAALADSHYVISKSEYDNRVITNVNKLSEEERIYEMARLLSGVDVTENTLIHAREMLEMSSKFRS